MIEIFNNELRVMIGLKDEYEFTTLAEKGCYF